MGEKIVVNPQALVMCPRTRTPPAKSAPWDALATSSGAAHNLDDVPGNIIGDEGLAAAAKEVERAHVRGDPVGQGLRPRRLGEGVVRRPEHRDEVLRLAYLPGLALHHRHGAPGVVDEHLLARAMLLAHHRIERRRPCPVTVTESAVLQPLGMGRLVLLPQQRKRHVVATQLAVNLCPVRQRPWAAARRG